MHAGRAVGGRRIAQAAAYGNVERLTWVDLCRMHATAVPQR
ncbi:hypothetical protein C7S17_1453 [Burkholderia thailandensis]|nr:hypothetical protein [Burkholderia thailandensis]